MAAFDGTIDRAGTMNAKVDLKALDVAPFAPLAGSSMAISGFATGELGLVASMTSGLSKLDTKLEVKQARYADDAIDLGGTLDLDLSLAGLEENDVARFDLGLLLEGGGRLAAKGRATLAGAVDAKVSIEAVDLSRVAAFVPADTRLDGVLTGEADLRVTQARVIERLDTTPADRGDASGQRARRCLGGFRSRGGHGRGWPDRSGIGHGPG